MKKIRRIILLAVLLLPVIGLSDKWSELENRVVEHRLDNGMRFLIFERHNAPLISFSLAVKVGSVNEVTNKTGIAHFLEHLAFKGTKTIGTTNYKAERKALAELDSAFLNYQRAMDAGMGQVVMQNIAKDLEEKQKKASSYIVSGEFDDIYSRNGGVGLNASTSFDYTVYVITLPSNRFELWAAMESDRMLNPVFREFYKEREVIMEERRMRTDNSIQGLFAEDLNAISYKAHPYGNPIIGHMSDIVNLNRQDVRRFYETYYVPQNITAAIVGDVKAEEIIPIIEKYFSRIPSKPEAPEVTTREPEQLGVKKLIVKQKAAMPIVSISFHTVPEGHQDEWALELLGGVLGEGQTSRLYKSLVEDKKMALNIFSWNYAKRYAGTFHFYAIPMEGVSAVELEKAILDEFAKIYENPITKEELDLVRARNEVDFYTTVSSNQGMARILALRSLSPGGWRDYLNYSRMLEAITPEDLMRVAKKYLNPDKRSVGLLEVKND